MKIITKPFILFYIFSPQAATGRIYGQASVAGKTNGPERHQIRIFFPLSETFTGLEKLAETAP